MHNPTALTEIKEQRRKIKNINTIYKENLNAPQKLALWITKNVGSTGFFFFILLWSIFWLTWNTLGPLESRFDPFPAFVLWIFISNMIQLLLLPLIMIGQNLQGKHAEIRAEADFEINTKSEKEIETIFQHLENQNELIVKILNRLEKRD